MTELVFYFFSVFGFSLLMIVSIKDLKEFFGKMGMKRIEFLFSNKPFTCILCLSFYIGLMISYNLHCDIGFSRHIAEAAGASAFSWGLNSIITGES